MDTTQLSGPLKVAVLMKALGKEAVQEVLTQLSDGEREQVMVHVSQLGEIAPEVVEKVAQEFITLAPRFRRDALPPASVPQPAAQADVPQKQSGEEDQGRQKLEAIEAMDPEQLADTIRHEHPQTIALIVSHLKPENASQVLGILPDELRGEVAIRIANLKKVMSEMVAEVDRVFKEILDSAGTSPTYQTGGIDQLADILNQSAELIGDQIMADIEEIDPELAARIKERMFVFDDLVLVDDRGMQKVLRQVETRELAVALKAAAEEAKDKVFNNMSQRAAEILQEEIESLGPVRMAEVEEAQQKVTRIIQEMESKGEIMISGRGGGDLVA
jgi:flagellar motor switch protein FliG